jgi:transposase-like protein
LRKAIAILIAVVGATHEEVAMAKSRMEVTTFVGKLLDQDDVDTLREGVRILADAVMEVEVSSQIGALPYERSTERTAYRNDYRTRTWDTRVGTIELKIPKVTRGSYFALVTPNNQETQSWSGLARCCLLYRSGIGAEVRSR